MYARYCRPSKVWLGLDRRLRTFSIGSGVETNGNATCVERYLTNFKATCRYIHTLVNRGRCCKCVPFLYGCIVSWICRYRLLSFAIVLWSFFCKKNGWETFLPGFVWLGISPHRRMYIVVKAFPISATTRPRRNCNFRVFSEVKSCGKFESIAY